MSVPVPAAKAVLRKARARRLAGAREEPVPSPCSSVCRIDAASGWCEGCLRSLDEIAAWGTLDDSARQHVWQAIEQRATAVVATGTDPQESR